MPNIRTPKWVQRMLFHLFAMSIFNASILYKLKHQKNKNWTILDFCKSLCQELAGDWYAGKENEGMYKTGYKHAKSIKVQSNLRLPTCHATAKLNENYTLGSKGHKYKASKCAVCSKETFHFCAGCELFMHCFPTDQNTESCFVQFHKNETSKHPN